MTTLRLLASFTSALALATLTACNNGQPGELPAIDCTTAEDCAALDTDPSDCDRAVCSADSVCAIVNDTANPLCLQTCQTAAECDDDDECTEDACVEGSSANFCMYTDICGTTPLVGDARFGVFEDGSAGYLNALVDDAQANVDYLTGELAALDAVPVGTCAEIPSGYTPGPPVTPRDLGTMRVAAGGSTLAETPLENGYYELNVPNLGAGPFDLVWTGSAFAEATTMTGALVVPPRAAFTGATGQRLDITGPTLGYVAQPSADYLILRIDYFDATQDQHTLRCNLNKTATSIDFGQAHYDAMSAAFSPSARIEAIMSRTPTLNRTSGPARLHVTSNRGSSISLYKPLP